MTLAEVGEIFAYWEDNPPPHLVLRAIATMLGWRSAGPARPEADIAGLAAAPPPGLAVAGAAGLDMPPPVLDIAKMRERNRR